MAAKKSKPAPKRPLTRAAEKRKRDEMTPTKFLAKHGKVTTKPIGQGRKR